MHETSHRQSALLWLAFLLGGVYRLTNVGQASFWIDEFVTEWIVRGESLAELTDRARYAYMPPLYFWLVKPFVAVLGLSAFSVRLPSVLFGIGALFTLHRLARVTAGRRVALVSTLLAAAHPELIWYAQEARVYSLGMFIAPVVIERAWTAARTGRTAPLVHYALAAALLGWAHHLFTPVIALLSAWMLYTMWRARSAGAPPALDLRRFVLAHLALFALLAPPAWWALSTIAAHRLPPTEMAEATIESLAGAWRIAELAVFVLVGALAAGLVQAVRPGREEAPRDDEGHGREAMALFAVLMVGVPVIHTAVGLLLDRPFFMVRYRMPVAALICPMAAWAVLSLVPVRRPAVTAAVVVTLLHLVFPVRMLATWGQASYHHVNEHWDDVLARVDDAYEPGALVLIQNPLNEYVYVDEQPDPQLESLLGSLVRSHYVSADVGAAWALPPGQPTDKLRKVISARLRDFGGDRVILLGWDDMQTLERPCAGTDCVRLDVASDFVFHREKVWRSTLYVGHRRATASSEASSETVQ